MQLSTAYTCSSPRTKCEVQTR